MIRAGILGAGTVAVRRFTRGLRAITGNDRRWLRPRPERLRRSERADRAGSQSPEQRVGLRRSHDRRRRFSRAELRLHERPHTACPRRTQGRVRPDTRRSGCDHRGERHDRVRQPHWGVRLGRRRKRRHEGSAAARRGRGESRGASGLGVSLRRGIARFGRLPAMRGSIRRFGRAVPVGQSP